MSYGWSFHVFSVVVSTWEQESTLEGTFMEAITAVKSVIDYDYLQNETGIVHGSFVEAGIASALEETVDTTESDPFHELDNRYEHFHGRQCQLLQL